MDAIITSSKKKFGTHLLLVGAKGSLARDDFTPYSDFDLIIIVDDVKKEQWVECMYNTTYIDTQVIALASVVKKITTITPEWPSEAGGKLNIRIYYDKNKTFEKLQKAYKQVKENKKLFENAVSLNTTIEYYSKALRYYEKKEFANLRWACGWLFEEYSMIMALLNQRYFTIQGPSAKIEEMTTFAYQPRGWKAACEQLICEDPKKNIASATSIVNILEALSKKHCFAKHSISSIKDMRFA